uniref:Uncharacterized protein LOC113788458 n=1 Tax=Dermatophagoides pteronyssinus TaxID=6956 RepID=A0A6P6XL69_DERPT|nr:uncharacterized protein LOC113788458 [Dermatophagoides pteronyssinus]
MNQIHSPYLRVFVLLHGAFGLQLLPITFTNQRSSIYLIINLLLNTITLYCIYYDSIVADSIVQHQSHKLYHHFLRLNFHLIYPIIYFCFIFNYLLYGYRIILLLDSPVFIHRSLMFDCRRNRLKALTIYLAVKLFWDHWSFVNNYHWIIILIYKFNWRQFKLLFGLYFYHIYIITTWFLLYYHQIVLYLTLQRIQQKLSAKSVIKNNNYNNFSFEKRLYRSIRNVSLKNQQIQSKFSLILAVIFLEHSIVTITSLCYLFLDQMGNEMNRPLSIYSHSLRFLIYFGLIEINRQNIQLFDQIERYFNCKIFNNNEGKKISSRFSQFSQLKLYRQYYPLSIFHFMNIDAITALELFFISLSFVLIISLA